MIAFSAIVGYILAVSLYFGVNCRKNHALTVPGLIVCYSIVLFSIVLALFFPGWYLQARPMVWLVVMVASFALSTINLHDSGES